MPTPTIDRRERRRAAAERRIARDARCRIQRPRPAAEFDRAGALYTAPTSVPPPEVQRSALDVHGSGVVERVEIVEVAALPLLVKVPGLFTTAVAPVSLPPEGGR